jgi:peptidyl-prolyl cis-trans isomerase SurA
MKPRGFWPRFFVGAGLLALAFAAGGAAAPARAQNTLRAVAVVNDEIVSLLDLVMRTRLAVLSSGITPTPEAQNRLQRQVLRQLIDERLQVQEADRLGITVPDAEVDLAIDLIASRNGMIREQFLGLLAQNDILALALTDRVRAEITWQQVMQIRLVPTIDVGEEEIDEVIARDLASQGQPEVRLSEIFLEVDSALVEDEVRRSAERLLEQLRIGTDFAALARQFSQAATAPTGGDLGWIQESELSDELASAVRSMQPGQIAVPVRGLSGFHILLLRERRIATVAKDSVQLKQVLLALPPGAGDEEFAALLDQAAGLRARIGSCADADRVAAEAGSPGSGDLGIVQTVDLPPELRRVVQSLPLGEPSEPLQLGGGVGLLVVCARQGGEPDRRKIEERLRRERLNMLARRYLRDLRRSANVDIRQ